MYQFLDAVKLIIKLSHTSDDWAFRFIWATSLSKCKHGSVVKFSGVQSHYTTPYAKGFLFKVSGWLIPSIRFVVCIYEYV